MQVGDFCYHRPRALHEESWWMPNTLLRVTGCHPLLAMVELSVVDADQGYLNKWIYTRDVRRVTPLELLARQAD